MEETTNSKNVLLHLQQLLQQVKKLSAFKYSDTNAFALTLLNRKRLQLEDEITQQVSQDLPAQYTHKNRTLKAILLCYQPKLKRKLLSLDNHLEFYYKEGLKGLQNEVETLIIFLSTDMRKPLLGGLS